MSFSFFRYIQLSSELHDVSQKALDHLIDKLLERVGEDSSPELITLPSLMIIGVVKMEMHIFANIT